MEILQTGIFKNDPNFVFVNMSLITNRKLSTRDKGIYFAICTFLNNQKGPLPRLGQIDYDDKTIKDIADIAKESELMTAGVISKFIEEGFFQLQEKRSC